MHGDRKYIDRIITYFYTTLFTSQEPTEPEIEDILQHVEPTVTSKMNEILKAHLTSEEAHKALLDTAIFFSKHLGHDWQGCDPIDTENPKQRGKHGKLELNNHPHP